MPFSDIDFPPASQRETVAITPAKVARTPCVAGARFVFGWRRREPLARSWAFVLWVCVSGLCSALAAQGQPAIAPEPGALVRQLGDESFRVRRRASQQLTTLGLRARDTLQRGLRHADPEIRRRCRWILQDVMQADYGRRLKAFIDDTEGKRQHDLPGWQRYHQTVGGDEAARELFAQMHMAEYGLLVSAAAGPQPAADALELRLRQVFSRLSHFAGQQRKPPSLGSTAALLFVASDPQSNLIRQPAGNQSLSSLVQQSDFRKALTGGKYVHGLRRLLGQWILAPSRPELLRHKLQLAVQHDVREGLDLALRAARDTKGLPGRVRVYAVVAIGRLGEKPYAAVLATFLNDKTECSRRTVNGKVTTIEVRDVALAWLIHATGQSHADYGLQRAKSDFDRMRKSRQYHVSVSNCGFETPAKRDEALKKWEAYVAGHPLPKPPEKASQPPAVKEAAAAGDKAAGKPAAQPMPAGNIVLPGAAMGPLMLPAIGDGSDEPPGGMGVELADRLQVRKLATARQLCRRQRYAEAVRLLDEILKAPSNSFFRPDVKVPLFQGLKPAAEQLIGRLPEQGLQAYELQFGATARKMLRRAAELGSSEALAEVAERFFYTTAGAEATYLLGNYHLHHGHPLHAALHLQRLRDLFSKTRQADRWEPALSTLLAVCWSRAAMPEAAEEVLRRMQARFPDATLAVAGGTREMSFIKTSKRPDGALDWLQSLVGPPQEGRDWGLGTRDLPNAPIPNPQSLIPKDVGSPFLKAESLAPISDDSLVVGQIEKLQTEHLDQHRVALPRLHPLLVGRTILLRTATHLMAIDFASGTLRWQSPLEDALRQFLDDTPFTNGVGEEKQTSPLPNMADNLAQGLQRRLWEDTAFGTLSSDGRYVFGLEDLNFAFRCDYQRMVVTPDGRWRLDPGALKNYNLLTAYDVRSGKLKWEIGGPYFGGWGLGIRDLPNAPTPNPQSPIPDRHPAWFLGPPLPLGGRLYVTAEIDNETRLLQLDAETGHLISQLTLAPLDRQPQTPVMFMPFGLPWEPARRIGVSPCYADGTLLCYTGEQHLVALDLITAAVRWIYHAPTPQSPPGINAMIGLPIRMFQPKDFSKSEGIDGWADAGVTIAQGRVLLTPSEVGQLICLDLADGRVCWTVDRRDGLYVGGVAGPNVIVVGRGSVWAVKLADGTPAWPQRRVPLPAGALPSGRGYLAADRYHLPLTTAEVVSIDVRSGRLVSRSRSPDGTIPGNLVACRDAVISQNVDALRRFDPLPVRRRQAAAAVAARPGDSQALADLGEVLLCQGELRQALGHLKRAMALKPSPRVGQLLLSALQDGLWADFDGFREPAEKFVPLIEDPEARVRFMQHLAYALQRAGDLKPALQMYLKLIAEPSDVASGGVDRLQHVSAARAVCRDRWVRARLGELRLAAEPQQRAEMDRQVAAQLKHDRMQPLLGYFGSDPAAHNLRLWAAQQLADQKKWFPAQRLLRYLLRFGGQSQRPAAIARLAELLREAGQPGEAARFYRCLGAELAADACLDGKTGRELLEALPAGDPVRRHLALSDDWPTGKVLCEASDRSTSIVSRYSIALAGQGGRFGAGASADVDSQLRELTVYDALGRWRWKIGLAKKPTAPYYGPSQFGFAQGWLNGHLLVARLGNRVYAVNTLGEKAQVLWNRETFAAKPPVPGLPVLFGGMGMRMPRQVGALPASGPLSLAVNDACVAFQQGRKLLAVDPLSGRVLFTRDDLRAGSDLFGDDELLFVTPPNSTEAAVLSAVDGRQLGRRRMPPLKDRVWTLGRRVLTFSADAEKARLTLVDPWAAKDVWQRDFDAKAQPWLVDGEQIGVLDPLGRLTVVSLPGGDVALTARVDPTPSLTGIVLLRSTHGYVLLANQGGPQANAITSQQHHHIVAINGRAYGFDRQTGLLVKAVWAVDVQDQALRLDQPSGLPLLVFANRTRKKVENRYHTTVKLLCLDKRNGRILHRQTASSSRPATYEIQAEPEGRRIEIRSYLGTARLTFTEDPPSSP